MKNDEIIVIKSLKILKEGGNGWEQKGTLGRYEQMERRRERRERRLERQESSEQEMPIRGDLAKG